MCLKPTHLAQDNEELGQLGVVHVDVDGGGDCVDRAD
jgi:hypothetical protein